jgi:hypothetical protein
MPQTVTGFDSRSDHVGFVVDQVAPGQVFVRVLWFTHVSIVPPMLHTHSFIYMLLLPEGQAVEAWAPSFGTGRRWIDEYCHLPSVVTKAAVRRRGTCRVRPTTQNLWRRLVQTSQPDMQPAVVTDADSAELPTSIILPLVITTLCRRFVLIVQCASSRGLDDLCFDSPAGKRIFFFFSAKRPDRSGFPGRGFFPPHKVARP